MIPLSGALLSTGLSSLVEEHLLAPMFYSFRATQHGFRGAAAPRDREGGRGVWPAVWPVPLILNPRVWI